MDATASADPSNATGFVPGDPADFDRLYRLCYRKLVNTLTVALRDRTEAEDCVQEAFVQAYRRWSSWRPEAHPEAWMFRIALNTARSHRRRAARRDLPSLLRRLGTPTPAAGPEESLFGLMSRLLADLAPRDSAIVVLRYHYGYCSSEIADRVGVSERTVRLRLQSIRTRLGTELGLPASGSSTTTIWDAP